MAEPEHLESCGFRFQMWKNMIYNPIRKKNPLVKIKKYLEMVGRQGRKWVENVVVGWLEVVYCGGRGKLSSAEPAVQNVVAENLQQTYMTALYHTYTTTRIDQLFNILIGECNGAGVLDELFCLLMMMPLSFIRTLDLKDKC
ncbi:hypothetical protein E2C01_084960 [Portunus trituberculatus]|uniref:Uncharacterized protein n=1 Tax=Portunus trituberculatus TaxID=210409 RepID=A0A5B7JCA0_PORTR|nr:hypothetical protein [Portunus trituberculatus]